jgi:hypothetical protein
LEPLSGLDLEELKACKLSKTVRQEVIRLLPFCAQSIPLGVLFPFVMARWCASLRYMGYRRSAK